MCALDAVLKKIARFAEVLLAGPARTASRMWTGPAHRRHNQLARRKTNVRTGLDDFGQRFVSDYEVWLSRRRAAIGKTTDFLVGAADAHVQHAQLHLARTRDDRLRQLDQLHLPASRKHGNGFHMRSSDFSSTVAQRLR
jgi:hypothetical protein